MISVVKIFSFSAAHHLPHHEGQCKDLHGHNYKLEVEVTGEPNPETEMIIDFQDLDCIVHKYIISLLDHKNLNDLWKNPTAERILQGMVNILSNLKNEPWKVKLKSLTLWETERCYAKWQSED